jgi:hypothetical protein
VVSAQDRQPRRADRGFYDVGRSNDDWCRETRRTNNARAVWEVREQTLSGIASLDVDTGGNGGIHVRSASGTNTAVRFRIVANAGSERDARDLIAGVRVSADGGRIRATGPETRDRESWAVSVEIEAPRELPMTLMTKNGPITVEGVSGRTRFDTTNGPVGLRDVSGDVRGRTVNGPVDIELDGSRWNGDGLAVETTNGRVSMALPSGYNATLLAETNHGGIDIAFPITRQGRIGDQRRRVDTTIGNGGAPLRIRTANGGVSVVRR